MCRASRWRAPTSSFWSSKRTIRSSIRRERRGFSNDWARRECMKFPPRVVADLFAGLKPPRQPRATCLLLLAALGTAACRQDMHDAPRIEVYEANAFFPDQRGSRTAPVGTVARGWLREDEALHTGKVDGQNVDTFPFAISHDDLKRGQQRFNIYCSPCHGRLGDG